MIILPVLSISAQSATQSQAPLPDVLTCKDGEKFVGRLMSSSDASVIFKSDSAGQVTIPWKKIQELDSSNKFALVSKGVKLHGATDEGKAPQGAISVRDQEVSVSSGPGAAPQIVAVTNVAQLVDEAAFQRAFRRRNFFQGWNGRATAGLAYTNSTQKSQGYTAAVSLTRVVPAETWLDQKSRTLLNFNQAYATIAQAGTPTAKTSVIHFGAEQDRYFTQRLFGFVQAVFDHDYSQGLDLQQDYGGGVGFVVFKGPRQEFDAKAGVDYISQQFAISGANKHLIASTFGESYIYRFQHGVVFSETGSYIPAWNDTKAYSALVNANVTFPAYRHFGFTAGGINSYLNDPPPGFKKNSFTLTLGLTYSMQ